MLLSFYIEAVQKTQIVPFCLVRYRWNRDNLPDEGIRLPAENGNNQGFLDSPIMKVVNTGVSGNFKAN